MPAQPTQQPHACWSCGYDISTLSTTVCPECGSDASSLTRRQRVPHARSIFTAMMGLLFTGGIAFMVLLGAAETNGITRGERLALIAASTPALAMAALTGWLLFAIPATNPERPVLARTLAAVFLAVTTTLIVITTIIMRH